MSESLKETSYRLLCRLAKAKIGEKHFVNSIQVTEKREFPVLLDKTTINQKEYMDPKGEVMGITEFVEAVLNESEKEENQMLNRNKQKLSERGKKKKKAKGCLGKRDESAAKRRTEEKRRQLELGIIWKNAELVFERLKKELWESIEKAKAEFRMEIIEGKCSTCFLLRFKNGEMEKTSVLLEEVETYARNLRKGAGEKLKMAQDALDAIENKGKIMNEDLRRVLQTVKLEKNQKEKTMLVNSPLSLKSGEKALKVLENYLENESQESMWIQKGNLFGHQEKENYYMAIRHPKKCDSCIIQPATKSKENENFKTGMGSHSTNFMKKSKDLQNKSMILSSILDHFDLKRNKGQSEAKNKLPPWLDAYLTDSAKRKEEEERQFMDSLILNDTVYAFFAKLVSHFCRSPSFELLFRASQHNFSSRSFHKVCDNQGPTLVIIKNEHGKVFGGFACKSWRTPVCSEGKKVHSRYSSVHDKSNDQSADKTVEILTPKPSKRHSKSLDCYKKHLSQNSPMEQEYLSEEEHEKDQKMKQADAWPEDSEADEKAVLFSFNLKKVFRQTQKPEQALLFCKGYGPSFGFGGDILVSDSCDKKKSFVNMGGTFDANSIERDEISGSYAFNISEYVVYFVKI